MPVLITDRGVAAIVDLEGAVDELAKLPSIRNVDDRRMIVDTVTAAALLDIALSLRPLAAEARDALNLDAMVEALKDPDEPVDDASRDFLVVGDLVHVLGDTEPGEVVKLGFDQGEAYADVAFANGHADRLYVRNLQRIIGDEPEPEFVEATVELVETADALTNPEDVPTLESFDASADVESDFADDPALDALKKATSGKKKGGKR